MSKPPYLYMVNPKVQKESIDEFCFNKCGKILVGGIDFLGGFFLACNQARCKYKVDQKYIGIFELAETGKRRIVARKLLKTDQLSLDFKPEESENE